MPPLSGLRIATLGLSYSGQVPANCSLYSPFSTPGLFPPLPPPQDLSFYTGCPTLKNEKNKDERCRSLVPGTWRDLGHASVDATTERSRKSRISQSLMGAFNSRTSSRRPSGQTLYESTQSPAAREPVTPHRSKFRGPRGAKAAREKEAQATAVADRSQLVSDSSVVGELREFVPVDSPAAAPHAVSPRPTAVKPFGCHAIRTAESERSGSQVVSTRL